MDSPALGARPDRAKTLFHRDRDGRLGASLRDYGRSISQVVCDDLGRPAANLFREALPPGGWPDPSGPTTEGAPRLDVEGLVAHHPCGPGRTPRSRAAASNMPGRGFRQAQSERT